MEQSYFEGGYMKVLKIIIILLILTFSSLFVIAQEWELNIKINQELDDEVFEL